MQYSIAQWESPYTLVLSKILVIANVHAKVGTFPLSYAVIQSFISCFTTLYCIDLYFILKFTF